MSKVVTIGGGLAGGPDKLGPGIAVANSGRVSWMGLDCLSERSLALGQVRRNADPTQGHWERIPEFLDGYGQFLMTGGRVVTNFGVANVEAAREAVIAGARKRGFDGLVFGFVHGDNVLDMAIKRDLELPEMGGRCSDYGDQVISANAYIGAEPIVHLLEQGANLVVGGRIADPSLFVAPICFELDCGLDDWSKVGNATVAGHILECGTMATGANYSDPPYRIVRNQVEFGAPLAEVSESEVIFTKLEGTGGLVDSGVAKSQLYYEVHDPSAYLTPDVTADFSDLSVEEIAEDRVRVTGGTGRERPLSLKVLVGLDLGWKSVGEISFGGSGCLDRMREAKELIQARLEPFQSEINEITFGAHGYDVLFGRPLTLNEPTEVRFRVAARCATRECATAVADEVFQLHWGPVASGGAISNIVPAIGVTQAFLPRRDVKLETEIIKI